MTSASPSAQPPRPKVGRTVRPGGLALPGLPRASLRLLRALDAPGAGLGRDPLRDDAVVVTGSRKGVSLGGGSHPLSAWHDLLGRDLVTGPPGPGGAISAVGRAHLRRLASPEPSDAFAAQHRSLERVRMDDGAGTATVAVNAQESPLAWLRRRRDRDGEPMIDAASFEAGERLRRDLTFAAMLPSVTARWDGAVGGGGPRDVGSAADTVIAARQRVRAALDEVGPDFADLLIDLCGFLKGLEGIERERGWPVRSAKVVVRLALRRLARHYGLDSEARGPDRSRGIRAWEEPSAPPPAA